MSRTNPYMSWWLSEANKVANTARGQFTAEMTRQQRAMTKELTEQFTQMWMAFWFPWMSHHTPKRRNRR